MFPRPRRIIVAQYAAPTGTSLLAAAELLGDNRKAIAAQVIDLVVRKVISIAPLSPDRAAKSGFRLTLRETAGLGADEEDLVRALFPRFTAGTTATVVPGKTRHLSTRLRKPHRLAVARLIASGRARERTWWDRTLTPWRRQPVEPTPAGYPTVDHLWGIRDYIDLAEKDRLNFLQSPSGAELRGDAASGIQILLLNEKLLPYAVLFGLEKQWAKELDLGYRSIDASQLEELGSLIDAMSVLEVLGVLVDLVDLAYALRGVGALVGGAIKLLVDVVSN